MSKEDAPNFRFREPMCCTDCKHSRSNIRSNWNINYDDLVCLKYQFTIGKPWKCYVCDSWESEE